MNMSNWLHAQAERWTHNRYEDLSDMPIKRVEKHVEQFGSMVLGEIVRRINEHRTKREWVWGSRQFMDIDEVVALVRALEKD